MRNRPCNEFGPLCRFELVALTHRGEVMGCFHPAFPARGTADRLEAREFAHGFVCDMERRGYSVGRRRAH